MLSLFRKINIKSKKNIITFIDIFIIVGIFFFIKNYYKLSAPTETSKVRDKMEYVAKIDKYKYNIDELMLINFGIKNRAKIQKVFEVEKESFVNYAIYRGEKLIYKKDILERNREHIKYISFNGYGRKDFGEIWYQETYDDAIIKEGDYRLIVYSQDMGIELELPFKIEKR